MSSSFGWFKNAVEKKTTPGWIDPEKKTVVVPMVQNVLVPKGGELRDKFLELAAGAVK
jgi:hypothetical protein